jgi:hypothetical protein
MQIYKNTLAHDTLDIAHLDLHRIRRYRQHEKSTTFCCPCCGIRADRCQHGRAGIDREAVAEHLDFRVRG